MLRFGFFFGLAALLLACEPSGQGEGDTARASAVSFTTYQVKEASANCATDSSRCTTAKASFPMVESGPSAVRSRMNDTLQYRVVAMLAPTAEGNAANGMTPDEAAAEFVAVYEEFLLEEPGYSQAWATEVQGEVLFESPQLATVELAGYSYTGGAHPNSYVDLITFDLSTGAVLQLSDIISDKAALLPLAERYFREARQLDSGSSLNDQGFFWDGEFVLPQSVGLVQDGLRMYYNSYEVAPYAAGPTEFTIPYEDLKPILTKPAMVGLE